MAPVAEDELHLWIVHDERIVDAKLLEDYCKLLSKEEAERQQNFYFQKHRHQYLITRALVRCVLSLCIDGVKPEEWRFGKNQYGKPFIQNAIPVPLYFNISHTDSMIVLVIARGENAGVDVEKLRHVEEMTDIAGGIFSQSEARLLGRLPKDRQRDQFFDIWTLKEAYVKARGEGLSLSLNHFNCIFSEEGVTKIVFSPDCEDHPEHWRFWRIFPNESHKIAIAYKNQAPHSSCSLVAREIVPLRNFERIVLPSSKCLPAFS